MEFNMQQNVSDSSYYLLYKRLQLRPNSTSNTENGYANRQSHQPVSIHVLSKNKMRKKLNIGNKTQILKQMKVPFK